MLVSMRSWRYFYNCFFLSIILFFICSSFVLDFSSFSSFCASISSCLYCSISSPYLRWKWSCNLTLSYSMSESRFSLVLCIFSYEVLGLLEACLSRVSYGRSSFCIKYLLNYISIFTIPIKTHINPSFIRKLYFIFTKICLVILS